MPIIVVSGHARKVGKTSVAVGLISAFPQYSWTALKISTHWHSEPSMDEDYSIYEEHGRDGLSDSSRFLVAGAKRAYWIRIHENRMAAAMQQLQPILNSSPSVIIEGNNILQYVHADLHIMVADYNVSEFKDSAQRILYQADALIAINREALSPSWNGVKQDALDGIPLFETLDPQILPPEFLALVCSRLTSC